MTKYSSAATVERVLEAGQQMALKPQRANPEDKDKALQGQNLLLLASGQ